MPTDTLRPNGSASLGWANPGSNHHLEVDDPGWPPTADDDTTDINETGQNYDVTDDYDLDAVTSMGAGDVANTIKISYRLWNDKVSGDQNDFYVDIIIDGSPVSQSAQQAGARLVWTNIIDLENVAWNNNAYTQAQINGMQVRIRCDTAKVGMPHDITSKITAIAVIVESEAPGVARRIFAIT